MNQAVRYAKSLQKRFNLSEIDTSQLTGDEYTVFDVASKVLDKSTLIQLIREELEENKQLRRKYGIEPVDKFEEETNQLIAELELK